MTVPARGHPGFIEIEHTLGVDIVMFDQSLEKRYVCRERVCVARYIPLSGLSTRGFKAQPITYAKSL